MTTTGTVRCALAVATALGAPALHGVAAFADGTGPAAASQPAPSAPARPRPWLDVKLPPAPAAGVPTGKAQFSLHDSKMVMSDFAGLRISVGGAAPRLVPTGQPSSWSSLPARPSRCTSRSVARACSRTWRQATPSTSVRATTAAGSR